MTLPALKSTASLEQNWRDREAVKEDNADLQASIDLLQEALEILRLRGHGVATKKTREGFHLADLCLQDAISELRGSVEE